ncbi:uncharacterized protein LOC143364166 [Halictus rubicundus]|uniref:uncharacterized protein LOC143364166 n=1 Tax=Halictus rubicundus TaxID=77578 RepID=UPI0040366479
MDGGSVHRRWQRGGSANKVVRGRKLLLATTATGSFDDRNKKMEASNNLWTKYKVKIFRNSTFDDYMKARNKAKAAEETSDLQSEAESPLERRKRPAFTLEDSTSSDEAAVFYPAPDLKKQRNIATCSHSVGEESQGEVQEDEIHYDKQCSIGKLRKIF